MSDETQVLAADAVAQEPAVLENEQNLSTESATEETTPAEPKAEADEEERRRKGGWQRKIEKQTKQLDEQAQQIAFLRGRLGMDLEQPGPAEAAKAPDKPARDKFASDEEFVDALTDWKIDRRAEQETQKQQEKAAVQLLFEARDKFALSVDDYHDVMRSATDVFVTQNMLPYLNDPEIGPELGYFLAKNPDEAKKLAGMGPVILAKTIVELQPRFKPDAPSGDMPKATLSQAPRPVAPVGKSASGQDEDLSTTTDMDKYKAWRRKQNPDWDRA